MLLASCQVNWTPKLPRTGIPSISRTKPSSSKTGTTWKESFLSWELVVAQFWRYTIKLVISCLFAVKDTCTCTLPEKSDFKALLVASAEPPRISCRLVVVSAILHFHSWSSINKAACMLVTLPLQQWKWSKPTRSTAASACMPLLLT